VQDYTENVRKNKPKTTKPVRKIKTNTIKYCEAKAKTSKRLKEKESTSIQSSPQLGPCHFYVSEDSELTDTDDETTSGTEKCCVCTVHTRPNSLFAEYGVIVRNLNYRP
jgi:hypothetical protein